MSFCRKLLDQDLLNVIHSIRYNYIVDAHCHLESELYPDKIRYEVINKAVGLNIVMITTPLSPSERTLAFELRSLYPKNIYVVTGYYPLSNEDIQLVIEFIKRNRDNIVGIGEVGLDFKPPNNALEVRLRQLEIFEIFIKLAKDLSLPLVVHSRSAGKYAIETLIKNQAENVLMHGFSGNAKYAKKAVEAGFYFSIPPTVIFSKQKQNLVRAIPIENILLETDSPVMSPNKETLNYPWNVFLSAKKISELKNLDITEVINITAKNALELFRISPP